MRGVLKFSLFFFCVTCFLLQHGLFELMVRNEERRLRLIMKSLKFWSRISLKILGIEVEASPTIGNEARFLVANHISYIDVLVLFSLYPSLFVTSVEIRETFLLGQITKLAGCFFVERRKNLRTPATLGYELDLMKKKFQAGFSVFIFPEGTSSTGTNLLPFKASYFQIPIDTQVGVSPLLIVYDQASRSEVPWIGKMTFPDHLFRLCCLKEINVKIIELKSVSPMEEMDRFQLAEQTHTIMSEAYAQY